MSLSSDNMLSLRFKGYGENIRKTIHDIQNGSYFSDVTLACADKLFDTHKIILSSFSPVLRDILKQNTNQNIFIYFAHTKADDLEQILKYMYEGNVNINQENMDSFLDLVDFLGLSDMTKVNGVSVIYGQKYLNPQKTSAKRKRSLEKECIEEQVSEEGYVKDKDYLEEAIQTIFNSSENELFSDGGDKDFTEDFNTLDDCNTNSISQTKTLNIVLNENTGNLEEVNENNEVSVHLVPKHENNQEEVILDIEKESQISVPKMYTSVHLNPDWLPNLKRNFKKDIIDNCSAKTRAAFENNLKLDNVKEKREVRMAIKSSLVGKLIEIHGGVSRPGIGEVRDLCSELQFRYPAMFKDDDGKGGYGLGGSLGAAGFANQVLDTLRKKDTISGTEDLTHNVARKGGKPKTIYGVIREKFYGAKVNKQAATLFRRANSETVSFEDREKVYEENRPDLQDDFISSKSPTASICRGFWKDLRHLANHFKYLTGTPDDLSKAVEENFRRQMDNLALYVSHTSRDEMLNCEEENLGSSTYKDIILTRRAADKLDKSGATLVRLETDGPDALTASPHLMAVCVQRVWMFEIYVDKKKVLDNLSFPQAIASFLHIAFVFNLEYPRESQTVADIWQRKFALYGTNTGTRTASKKETAQNKIKKYLSVLDRLQG